MSNKLSIDKRKYTRTFVDLSPEEVKEVLLALLRDDLSHLNPTLKMLAQIIYNENFTLRETRRKARTQNAEVIHISTKSYPHFEQNEQNEQNPLNNPPGLIKNINNNKYTSAREGNVFNKHLNTSERVPVRSDEERRFYIEGLKDIFELYTLKKGEKESDHPEYAKRKEALLEVIDTLIEAREQAESVKGLKFKGRTLKPEDLARITIDIVEENIKPVLNYLNFPVNQIRNRPYYILSCLINNSDIRRGAYKL